LELLKTQPLPSELDWQRACLVYQVKRAMNDLNGALVAATNMKQIAALGKSRDWRAESAAALGEALEKLGRLDEASAAYQENLAAETPEARQRQAILEVAELAIARKNFADAEQRLEKFLAQFPDSPALDIALLTLGELRLRDYAAQPVAETLTAARAAFDKFISTFPDSPLIGKAHLGRGWTYWFAEKYLESAGDFNLAVRNLPLSEDLAVARFKLGDALLAQQNFSGALANYREVLENFQDFPAVVELGDRALYQSLRAHLATGNLAGASNAMARIATSYPASALTRNGALLMGESLGDAQQPHAARELFRQFAEKFAGSPLDAQVALAVARTYERERDWSNAIKQYAGWLEKFPANELQPQAGYALAWANFQAGNETNALALFTEFVAQFPTNELAPLAQWWVADHFYRAGDFLNAEKNYKHVFENWPVSGLRYEARMMAGRAAAGRTGYPSAIRDYFSKLEDDTNCPMELRVQATFAHGSALMSSDATETNKPFANFELAANVFDQICQRYPTNEWGALAWGEKARCYQQLGAQDAAFYDKATNAYAQVFSTNSPANPAARFQAQIGFGMVLEKKAALAAGEDRTALLVLALENYRDVFDAHLDPGAAEFWVKKAGLQIVPLIELPELKGVVGDPDKFITDLEGLLPQLTESLEKERPRLAGQKN
jgi:TolA-binding protein